MKRTLFKLMWLIIAALLIFNTKLQIAYSLTSGDYEYTLAGSNATITRYIGAGGNITIPATIDGYIVTSIGESAFYSCDKITSVTIGNNVKSIGDSAFRNCWSLTNVTIGDSVTSIGSMAFSSCNYLSKVTIGNNVTTIGQGGFHFCESLTSVNIPNSVTSVGNGAFDGCTALKDITIGNHVKTIGDYAFSDCGSLTSIIIPNSVTSIGVMAFYYCENLTNVTIGNKVTNIDEQAFYYCKKLNSIVIPGSVTNIGYRAFSNCSSLTKAIFFGDAPNMGYAVFGECASDFKVYYYYKYTAFSSPWYNYTTIPFYIVTYNGNGNTSGAVPVDNNLYLNGAKVTVLGNTGSLAKTGYTFAGWNTKADGSGTTYQAGSQFPAGAANATLYAKWIAAPGSLTAASSGYNSIKISWGAVSGANGYQVYRAASSTGKYSLVSTTTATSFTNTGLTTGNAYYYKVRAYTMAGTAKVYSDYSAVVSSKPVLKVPGSLTAASSGYNSIKISWGAVSGANGYQVYRAASSTGKYSLVSTTTSTNFTNKGLTTGTAYYYKVRAYRAVGTTKVYSSFSKIVSAKPVPAVPANFKAARVNGTSIKVSWSAVTGASGYEIYRATTSKGTYGLIKTTTALNYLNTGLKTGKTYYYKMRAYRIVNGIKVYGNWTTVVKANTY